MNRATFLRWCAGALLAGFVELRPPEIEEAPPPAFTEADPRPLRDHKITFYLNTHGHGSITNITNG